MYTYLLLDSGKELPVRTYPSQEFVQDYFQPIRSHVLLPLTTCRNARRPVRGRQAKHPHTPCGYMYLLLVVSCCALCVALVCNDGVTVWLRFIMYLLQWLVCGRGTLCGGNNNDDQEKRERHHPDPTTWRFEINNAVQVCSYRSNSGSMYVLFIYLLL